MKRFYRTVFALAVSACVLGTATAPAFAQEYYGGGGPRYDAWQPQWDEGRYDHRHVMFGTVARFRPYRLWIRRGDGELQEIDLRNGTVIRPIGATPHRGDRVALVGHYSDGTFVAARVILH